jgi:hypothetical protein
MGTTSKRREVPRATIHKQIIDAAAANPEASLEALAEGVAGASTDLVERVLDEYGDPSAEEEPPSEETDASEETPGQQQMSDDDPLPRPEELTDEQQAVLHAIERYPRATQAEIADHVGVSAATVNRRVNKIDGFDWEHRVEIARELLPTSSEPEPSTAVSDGGPGPESNGDASLNGASAEDTNGEAPVSTDTSRVAAMERRLDQLEARLEPDEMTGSGGPFEDPELAAKVVRACMASDTVTESEEVQVLERLLGG